MTGSMWREYEETGDFVGLGLPGGLREWADFTAEPLFTPSTKGEEDVNFNPRDVEAMTGIDTGTFSKMEALCRKLFELGTARAAGRGLILIDTKYEVGVTPDGQMIILDEVHTPDSSRFVYAEGFKESVARGERPRHLSKEFLRELMLVEAGGVVAKAKELMKQPLPPYIVKTNL